MIIKLFYFNFKPINQICTKSLGELEKDLIKSKLQLTNAKTNNSNKNLRKDFINKQQELRKLNIQRPNDDQNYPEISTSYNLKDIKVNDLKLTLLPLICKKNKFALRIFPS